MTKNPSVVVHVNGIRVEDRTLDSIRERCEHLIEEFHEVSRFEITLHQDGLEFSAQTHATGKNTDVSTHAVASEPGAVVDQALDKVERQLRKVHDKRIFSPRRAAQKDPAKRKAAL
jgi:ribosome-associated translation inhibitor RaiA